MPISDSGVRPHLTYSLIPVTLAFVAGIAWAKFAQVPEAFSWMLIVLLATRLIIALRRQQSPFTPYLILPLFFLLGGVHTTPFLTPPTDPHHIYNHLQNREEAVITGVLLKAPEIGPDKSHLLIRAEHLQFQDRGESVSGRVRLTLAGHPEKEITPGDRVMARATLARPRSFQVPGAFDYQAFLSYQSIWVTGWLKSNHLLTKTHPLLHEPLSKEFTFLAEKLRQRIGLFLNTTLPLESSGIYKAILTGDRSSIPQALTEQYKSTGSIHLLAISGMHMGLLTISLSLLISWLVRRSERLLLTWPLKKTTSILCLLPLGVYAFIAGFHPPVVRALLMTYVIMAAIIFNRQWSITNNIAIAALVILSITPTELYTVSFQLSFAAVSAIALIYPQLSTFCHLETILSFNKSDTTTLSWGKKIGHLTLASILLSLAATIGTAPLLAFHFNRISLLSPITTLLIEPFLCLWSLLLGLIACLFIPFPLASFIFKIGAIGITASNWLTSHLAQFPMASIWLSTPSLRAIIIYYTILTLLVLVLSKKVSKEKIIIYILCFLTLTSALFFHKTKKSANSTIISVLDIGQGQAVVLEFPGEKTFLLDGGKAQGGTKSTFNIGESLIAPFLWNRGISKLDGIIISHPHADHYNGLPFIIEHFAPSTVWLSTTKGEPAFNALISLAQKLRIPLKLPANQDYIYQNKENEISLQSLTTQQKGYETNNKGLVIRLKDGNRSILFPGDIERESEEILVTQNASIKADVFLAPHHGSITSSTTEFIQKIAAQEVVVSAANSKWGKFPNREVVERYKKEGLKIRTTGQRGTITITIAKDKITIEP